MNRLLLSPCPRLQTIAAAVTLASWPLWPTQLAAVPLTFSAQPTLAEITSSRVLAQPLLPMGSAEPSAAERSALAQALVTFNSATSAEDTSALEGFLTAYPQSAFQVSLLTNLGLMYRQNGYWSKALSAWQKAWQAGKSEMNPGKQLVVDQALSHLAELTARLGRVDDLSALLTDAGNRVMHGGAAQKYHAAQESLFLMHSEPTKSFRCGPFAVGQVVHALHPGQPLGTAIHDSVSTDHGTSLVMVNAFARSLGLNYQLAYRNAGAAVLVPSVVNWKVGHYAALTQEVSGRYVVRDPTFTDSFVVSEQALDQEASGYFLVPAGTLPPGWRTVSDQEGQQVWGKGAVTPDTLPTPPGDSPHPCPTNPGMVGHSVDLSRVNLYLTDTPFFYSPPRGPAVAFTASYSQRDSTPNTVTSFSNLGLQWNFNWVAFIVDDPQNVTTSSYGPGGGTLTYANYNTGTEAFAPQADTQAVLQRTSATSYVRTFPDGSRQVFGFAQTILKVNYIFMTESDDPAGNRTLYNYNASTGRLDTVVDTMGNTITLTYGSSNSGDLNFFSIYSLSDQAGRTASFTYDSAGRLQQITDMVGLWSKFTYAGTSDMVTGATTPYGTTTYSENDTNDTLDLLITDPEEGHEHVLFERESSPPDASTPPPSAPHLIVDSYLGERNTYYWDKQACALGRDDLTKAHLYHWLEVPMGGAMSDIVASDKPALESRTYYTYVGQALANEPY